MICNDAFKLLTMFDGKRGKRIGLDPNDQLMLQELEKNGYVLRINLGNFDPYELSRARSELARLQDLQNMESTALKERELRKHILALSELSARKDNSLSINGIDYIITFRGKELAQNLMPRLMRIGNKQLIEFEKEISDLNNTFTSWSKRSFGILEYLSPLIPQIDEIHCRSLVIGLSSRPESAKEISDAFVFALGAIEEILNKHDRKLAIAECIMINLKDLSKENISSAVSKFHYLKVLAGKYASNDSDAIDCALFLYPLEHSVSQNESFLRSALDFARKMDVRIDFGIRLEAALLIEVMGLPLNEEIIRKFQEYYDKINTPGTHGENAGTAAALIVIGIYEGHQMFSRFEAVLSYLNRFSDGPMLIPAAMLSHLSPEIEETLDTLRLASSAIARQKLSLGGMENLSLGMKMLLQSSVISSLISIPAELKKEYIFPHEIIPLQTLGILSLSMLPVALTAFAAFHELSMHKLTVSDYSFHPVHTNFAYG